MVDKILRVPKEQTLAPIALKVPRAVHPILVTLAAVTVGLGAGLAIWQHAYGIALGLWLLNRLLDGLDGTVARIHDKQTDFGGYLDMVLDTVVYALIPVALVLVQPSTAGWLSLVLLLSSFYINGASWMYLAALCEKRNRGAAAQGELTTITMPSGIIEGAETLVFYTLFLLFPGAIVYLFSAMALLVFATAAQRLMWAARYLD